MRGWGLPVLSPLVTVVLLLTVVPATAASTAARVPLSPTSRVPVLTQPALAAVPTDFAGVPGLVQTRIHWTRWSRYVVYGGQTVLEGQVVTEDGSLPEVQVDLYARRSGASRWDLVDSTTTSADTAVFAFDDHEPSRSTDYRVVFEGDLMYTRAEAGKAVPVRRRVRDRMRRVDASHYAFTGSVDPRYRDRPVRLQRKNRRRCSWGTIATKRTTRTSRWRFRVSGPDNRGTWYFRAVVPGSRHYARSYSDHVWALSRR